MKTRCCVSKCYVFLLFFSQVHKQLQLDEIIWHYTILKRHHMLNFYFPTETIFSQLSLHVFIDMIYIIWNSTVFQIPP